MFTGLIETRGTLERTAPLDEGVTLTIGAPPKLVAELTLGESVAVDGCCLTVTSTTDASFDVDASAETLRCTTLSDRGTGDPLHLERAMRLGDRLGGHLVSGHIDGTGVVHSSGPLGEAVCVWYEAPAALQRYLVPKGSVAVDGVSLTINEVDGARFSVALIPHTQSIVHLHQRAVGGRVNLEADMIGKYVERLLRPHAP